ncbi:MAG TPA: MarR family transcriptional regulator [Solirubrobacteraceae bacterium]|nr:MarR family transcriptional regulator [Solirubrobacteraceae bacterium]
MASSTRQTTHPAQSLALLAHLARVGQRETDSSLPGDLRTAHLMLLTLLRDHGATTQTGLAEALRLDPSNLVGLLNDLERRGMVIRQHHPDDRRRHIVTIADDGITELRTTEQRLAAAEDRLLGALDPEERATLHCLLMRAAGGQLPPCNPTKPD